MQSSETPQQESNAAESESELQEVSKVLAARDEYLLRKREVDFGKQIEEQNHEFAKLALQAQERDRQHERDHAEKRSSRTQRYILTYTLVICIFLLVLVGMGQSTLATEIIRAAVYLLTGGAGGYAVATRNSKRTGKDSPQK